MRPSDEMRHLKEQARRRLNVIEKRLSQLADAHLKLEDEMASLKQFLGKDNEDNKVS